MNRRTKLLRRFRDKEYRDTYVDSFVDSSIAAQIRALRESRGLNQTQLANLIGTKQSGVSKLENVNYSGWNVRTLKALAKALDVALLVKFVSFGEALIDIEKFSQNTLVRPTFAQDPTFVNIESQTLLATTAPLAPIIPVRTAGQFHTVPVRMVGQIHTGSTGGDLLQSL